MDGLSRAIGSPSTLTIKGKTYQLDPIETKKYGEIENHILAQRKDPFEILADPNIAKLPERMQDRIVKEATTQARASNTVSPHELGLWMDTYEGMQYTFWMSIRGNHPEFEHLEDAAKLFTEWMEEVGEQAIKEYQRKRDQSSGTDMMGNSTGRTMTETEGPAESEEKSLGEN